MKWNILQQTCVMLPKMYFTFYGEKGKIENASIVPVKRRDLLVYR